ncbi:MAG: hypothetical protein R3B84_24145 [Zavarzinella sp.]
MVRFERSQFRTQAAKLLDQQLWCWGRDILHPKGNLLLDLGMCRYRDANHQKDGTMYSASTNEGNIVWLWGFGIMCCSPQGDGVFLQRSRFEPKRLRHRPPRPVHYWHDLPLIQKTATRTETNQMQAMLKQLFLWISQYEHWIAETQGVSYRQSTIEAAPKKYQVPGAKLAWQWSQLAKKLHRLNTSDLPAHGVWATAIQTVASPTPAPAVRYHQLIHKGTFRR